ncbi:MAG: chromate transporter, partial [Alphaproteobacteria bacterium]|nr:chromate transporter [Alphaproteobacteria bacterium]
EPGWIHREGFVAGYGAAQAVPGPLFTFAAYLGAAMGVEPNGLVGAAIALVAVFLPGALLIVGAMPFWSVLRARKGVQGALAGVNAAVVGLLGAAFYDPIWMAGVPSGACFALAAAAFVALEKWRVPPWLVVLATALAGAAIAADP